MVIDSGACSAKRARALRRRADHRPAGGAPPRRGLRPALLLAAIFVALSDYPALAEVDEGSLGAWYMYFWNHERSESAFGWQGDIQYRAWDALPDMEQLLLRGGLTWRPGEGPVKLTLGVAHITTGEYGRGSATVEERRLYQEALIPQRLGRAQLTHRLRLEQRDVDGQSTRNRARYFVALNYPLNGPTLAPGAIYASIYNELFLNLENDIGGGREVDYYDRNRSYAALGYVVSTGLRLQFGYMHQDTADWDKGQLQLNIFHAF